MSRQPQLLLTLLVSVWVIGSAAGQASTPVEQCVPEKTCVVQGQLIASHGTGSINDGDACVSVALPDYVPMTWNFETVKAFGTVYKAPSYPGLVTFNLRGREVDAEACYSGLVMYVDRIEKTSPRKRSRD